MHGSIEDALMEAINESSLERRQNVLKQWRDWNKKIAGNDTELARTVDAGFGVCWSTKGGIRPFMEWVYDEVLESVKRDTEGQWKQ